MELGSHIVQELNLSDRGDTLSRWLAHHVAQLIRDAQEGPDVETRKEAKRLATETILTIWDHRASLPGNVNPLAQYRGILEVLSDLRPDPKRWPIPPAAGHKSGQFGNLYRRIPRLLSALLLLDLAASEKSPRTTAKTVRKFLKAEENSLLSMFEVRFGLFENSSSPTATKEPKGDHEQLRELANKLILETIADLKTFQILSKSERPV